MMMTIIGWIIMAPIYGALLYIIKNGGINAFE
jgi:hypothetical protein